MNRYIFFSLLILQAQISTAATFEVVNLRNANGVIRCALYKDKAGFPDNPGKALEIVIADIDKEMKSSCSFDLTKELPAYVAISVLHDEDNDGKMKTNFIGIPKEGWAVSNNAKSQKFGPPLFEDSKFEIKKYTTQILKINY